MAPSASDARRAAAALLLLLVAGRGSAQDAYPTDITPPPGTRYPCALTALPRGLPGIPEADRAYVNRTYARILRATQAKLVLLKALEEAHGIEPALAQYGEVTRGLGARQGSDVVPVGLEPFQAEVLGALDLQQAFFSKAAAVRQAGRGMDEVYAVTEGRQASARLIAAWSRMQARYPGWPPETRDSIYHHLCALDLF
jgi:hypothetical protein